MNADEQRQRKTAIDELRAHVAKSIDDSDKSMTILVTEHAKLINERLKELEQKMREEFARGLAAHVSHNVKTHDQIRKEIEVVHQKAIKSEAILARTIWGRLKWLARGR